ncbi:M15 family metallopeptidase [Sphingomonas hankookensis]
MGPDPRGLDALVPFFHKAGWYWGGGYRSISRKDAMHFECGLTLVRSFLA